MQAQSSYYEPYNPARVYEGGLYQGTPVDAFNEDILGSSVVSYVEANEQGSAQPAPEWNYEEWVKTFTPPSWTGSVNIVDTETGVREQVAPSGSESWWNFSNW
ncbi:MAG: hypothetical protein AAB899_02925 [Patescibacteria group bacterium]